MNLFGYTLIKKDYLVRLEKAQKLARKMTDVEIDDVLHGKAHFHLNPKKRVKEPLVQDAPHKGQPQISQTS